jgi:anti-sigma regulatory factor (Ser/Thr protein kinase)
MSRSTQVVIRDASHAGELRRRASELARSLKLNETQAGRIGIVATELATNIVKHAREGQILMRELRAGGATGLELLAVDKGPGMADVSRCLEDGYSTAGSPGTGLGAIARLSNVFDIYAQAGAGAAVLAQVWQQEDFTPAELVDLGAVCVPAPYETACGDNWAITCTDFGCKVFVADGLGHGPLAAQASDEAVAGFLKAKEGGPAELLQRLHGPLRATRGASVAVAELMVPERQALYAGVGNISGVIIADGGTRSMVSHNGTLGHEVYRMQTFVYPWQPHSLVVMHSDGLQSRWRLDNYPGLVRRHPSLIAGILYRDYQRGRDDATVVVVRERQQRRS